MKPQLVLLAGPNGGGKSTFYDQFLSASKLPFLNADLVAAKSGIDSFAAARMLDDLRARMIDEGNGFITETVFSDPDGAKMAMLAKAVAAGYDVMLIYIGIAMPALSERRVAQRVALGGHDVPTSKLKDRYERSLANLAAALGILPMIKIYDNSSERVPYRLVATIENRLTTFQAAKLPRWLKGIRLPKASRAKR